MFDFIKIAVTKFFDDWLSIRKEKREFAKKEIQNLKELQNEIAFYYEIFSSYRDLGYKEKYFIELYDKQFALLAKVAEYKELRQLLKDFFQNINCLIDDLRKSYDDRKDRADLKKSYDDFILEITKTIGSLK